VVHQLLICSTVGEFLSTVSIETRPRPLQSISYSYTAAGVVFRRSRGSLYAHLLHLHRAIQPLNPLSIPYQTSTGLYTPHTPHSTLLTLHALHTPHNPHSTHSTLHTLYTPHTLHSTHSTLHTLHTPHTPHTPHSTHSTLHALHNGHRAFLIVR
jgi:hypothetical protein